MVELLEVSKEEVIYYINKLQTELNNKNTSIIISNRDKNKCFINKYNITTKFIIHIVSELSYQDFCKKLVNRNEKYKNENLFLFAPVVTLKDRENIIKRKYVYLKINFLEEDKTVIIVSIHECKYKLKYMFKEKK